MISCLRLFEIHNTFFMQHNMYPYFKKDIVPCKLMKLQILKQKLFLYVAVQHNLQVILDFLEARNTKKIHFPTLHIEQSLVTHESPETLNGIIVKLDIFAINQVLELTLLKQKWSSQAVKCFQKIFYHHSRWKLTWNNTTLDLLGIEFSGNLHKSK